MPMLERFLTGLQKALGTDARTNGSGGSEAVTADRTDGNPARMFVCTSCNRSYIAREMETCSECGEVVRSNPTGKYRRDCFV